MVTDSGDISAVSLPDVWAARSALSGIIRRTPLLREDRLNEILGCDVRLKAEQLQRTGSFKFRGLYHRVRNLDDEEREAGIITVSAGNAALASAMSARLLDIDCTVVMPEQAVETKFRAVERLGATVVRHGRNALEMFQKADELVASRGYAVVHPFGQPEVIAGHGTLGLELLEEVPDVDYVLAPASGGGLISGLCVAIKNLNPRIGVIGIQPEGSDGLRRSFLERTIVACETVDTLADGLTASGRLRSISTSSRVMPMTSCSSRTTRSSRRWSWCGRRCELSLSPPVQRRWRRS